ncbi:MAG: RidA family protein [Candidatus Caldatribacterium sp.]|nr:RidA family protein [Candidatus Caldatribacterium sp.]
MKKAVSTDKAPQAIGPYSQAVQVGECVFVSGQLGLSPKGELVSDEVTEQARQALENISAILRAAGLTMEHVVQVTIFLTDLREFPAVNEVYAQYFKPPYPARCCVGVSALPRGGKVEIAAVAYVPREKSETVAE